MDNFVAGIVTFTIASFATIINFQSRKIKTLRGALKTQLEHNRAMQERIYKTIWERGSKSNNAE